MNEFLQKISGLSPKRLALLCLEMRQELDVIEAAKAEPIAIIGMGCRFPGGADDPESYWRILRNGVDAVSEVPRERWDVEALFDADPEAIGKMYTRCGGFLRDIDLFDPTFFDITPREAVNMDPQQRILLEVAWEALERAGQAPRRLAGSKTAVYVGIFLDDYSRLMMRIGDPRLLNAYSGTGNTFSIASGRISYVLGLQGPNLSLDTACSSSLVAIDLACQSLRTRASDMALAAGVNLMLVPDASVFLCKAHALSPDGRSKTFDARADGYSRAEGCGVVVLKRLSDALAARDNVLAVIRGTANNHDGPSSGLTVPNGAAQETVIRAALANGRVDPREVSCIEAHGTGTALGDPIEMKALSTVFGPERAAGDPLYVTSVKTNIGHAEAAAGVAGVIRLVLSLEHREIPPQVHFETLNPHISADGAPWVIPTVPTPWNPPSGRRIAGVSSFGLSGSNAHVVIEEAPPLAQEPNPNEPTLYLLPLSAKGKKPLVELANLYAEHLAAHAELALGDVCMTAGAGRDHHAHRATFLAASRTEMVDKLRAFARGETVEGVAASEISEWGQPKIAFLFTGQGAQYTGMGRELYLSHPSFRATLDRCAEILAPRLDAPLLDVLWGAESASCIDETAYTQPALFALEYALAELWRSWGVEPTAVLGHSVGEYVAACLSGVFSLEDGLLLIAERARLMQELPRDGAMAAVFAGETEVLPHVESRADRLAIAAVNAPDGTVISGDESAVLQALAELEAKGIRSRRLTVSHAFHSPLLKPMLAPFTEWARQIDYGKPSRRLGLVSNVTGDWVRDELASGPEDRAQERSEFWPQYWAAQVARPVRFAAGVETLRKAGYSVLVEVGPQPTLVGLAKRCVPESSLPSLQMMPSLRKGRGEWRQLLESLGELYRSGVEIDWVGFARPYARRTVVLPTYPWQRKRYWVEGEVKPLDLRSVELTSGASTFLLGRRVADHARFPEALAWEVDLDLERLPFVADHKIGGLTVAPMALFLEMAAAAAEAADSSGSPRHRIADLVLHRPLLFGAVGARRVQVALERTSDGLAFSAFSRASAASGATSGAASGSTAWTLHATARVELGGAA